MLKPNTKCLFFCLYLLAGVAIAAIENSIAPVEKGFAHLQLSPGGDKLLFDSLEQPGLYLADLKKSTTETIATGHSVAYRAAWSHDARYIGFKRFIGAKQVASLYDVQTKNIKDLCTPGDQVGIPSLSNNNLLSFTVNQQLVITTLFGRVLKTYQLAGYCNQSPISPDGLHVAFTDNQDQLFLLSLNSGRITQLTNDQVGYFEPRWSPSSDALLATSLDGQITVFELATNQRVLLGNGLHAGWDHGGERVLFTSVGISIDGQFHRDGLFSVQRNGLDGFFVTTSDHDYATAAEHILLFCDRVEGQLLTMAIPNSAALLQKSFIKNVSLPLPSAQPPQKLAMPSTMVYFDIPYLHQAYDTPDWFNGSSACGGASAVMCLAYYGLLTKWPTSAAKPYRHNSDYGRYVCEKYTFNGFAFDIGGNDPNGNTGYGSFGFIIQNNWQNTKEYMAQYARLHGLASLVDWTPSRAKLQKEMTGKMPTVILTSLTSAGHYICAIGYDQEATSVVFNDPWGDKNLGYSNYEGRHAIYDWPGFSNGHQNLETVHCFIYFRGQRPDLTLRAMAKADTVSLNDQYTVIAQILNPGMMTSAPAMARLVLSTNAYYDSTDVRLLEIPIPAMTPTDTMNVQLSCAVPDTFTSGTYALGLQVDADQTNIELNETNNFMYTRLTIIGRPKLYGMSPLENTTNIETRPMITCYYMDKLAPIDPADVQMKLDQVDVTSASLVDGIFINYQPTQPLQQGEHTVTVRVVNKAGFSNEKTWRFNIQSNTRVTIDPTASTSLLFAGYPNPFNSRVTIQLALANQETASLEIFNITGVLIKTLNRDKVPTHSLYWDGQDDNGTIVPSGVYFCRMTTPTQQKSIRLLLLK